MRMPVRSACLDNVAPHTIDINANGVIEDHTDSQNEHFPLTCPHPHTHTRTHTHTHTHTHTQTPSLPPPSTLIYPEASAVDTYIPSPLLVLSRVPHDLIMSGQHDPPTSFSAEAKHTLLLSVVLNSASIWKLFMWGMVCSKPIGDTLMRISSTHLSMHRTPRSYPPQGIGDGVT
jgi:hypothetical protein